jgi:hypothetical protein
MISFAGAGDLPRCLQDVRPESTVCLLAIMTDLLTALEYAGSILGTVDPLLSELKTTLRDFSQQRPTLRILISPPFYRQWPSWYRQGLPTIAKRLSETFSRDCPPAISLLPGFSGQDLLSDGINLTPVAGLHYLLHLVDDSEILIKGLKLDSSAKQAIGSELARQTSDRLTYLESDHCRLVKVVDTKLAESSEFDDYMLNRSEEDWLVITGLPRLGQSLSKKDWQRSVRQQVGNILLLLSLFSISCAYKLLTLLLILIFYPSV